jgi:ribosomal protein S18 acetylase RimI-like enzyme
MFGGGRGLSSTSPTGVVDDDQQPFLQRRPRQHSPFPGNHAPPPSTGVPSITFRPIEPKDRTQIQSLHEEWFPVEYQQDFYDDLCFHRRMCHSHQQLYTMVATIPKSDATNGDNNNNNNNNTYATMKKSSRQEQQQPQEEQEMGNNDENENDEMIVACIVGCVLSAHKLNKTSRQLLVPDYPSRHGKLFYIMTLGTVTEYRHLGLASLLVQQVMDSVIAPDADVATLYLHVITLNEPAISFYENKLGFWKVQEIQDYYTIDGSRYNCYLYAKYFHGTSE